MPNKNMMCSYCKQVTEEDPHSLAMHVLECPDRPELGLTLKIQVLETAGDNLLATVHSVVSALASVEGMRSKSWQIYHLAKELWEEVKQLTPDEVAEFVRKEIEPDNGQEEAS